MPPIRRPFHRLIGRSAYGSDGIRIGQVRQILVDEVTGGPEWVSIATGILGARQRLAPIDSPDLRADSVVVPFTSDLVSSAPRIPPTTAATATPALTTASEEMLYRHYGMTDPDPNLDPDTDTDPKAATGPRDAGPTPRRGRPSRSLTTRPVRRARRAGRTSLRPTGSGPGTPRGRGSPVAAGRRRSRPRPAMVGRPDRAGDHDHQVRFKPGPVSRPVQMKVETAVEEGHSVIRITLSAA